MRRRLGVLLVSLVIPGAVLAGCSSADSGVTGQRSASSATGSVAESQATAGQTRLVTVTASIRDGKVRPPTQRVKVTRGDTVRLELTSDVDDEVHVHGYEAEEALEAGRTTTVEFVADQAGLFEIETHEGGLVLAQLEVR